MRVYYLGSLRSNFSRAIKINNILFSICILFLISNSIWFNWFDYFPHFLALSLLLHNYKFFMNFFIFLLKHCSMIHPFKRNIDLFTLHPILKFCKRTNSQNRKKFILLKDKYMICGKYSKAIDFLIEITRNNLLYSILLSIFTGKWLLYLRELS